MRYLSCFFASILCIAAAGCDAVKYRELSARVQQLEAEKNQLQAENQMLQSELELTKKELDEVKNAQQQLTAVRAQLKDLVKQYGAALNVAKDLGLPELQGISLDDVLNKLVPESEPAKDDKP